LSEGVERWLRGSLTIGEEKGKTQLAQVLVDTRQILDVLRRITSCAWKFDNFIDYQSDAILRESFERDRVRLASRIHGAQLFPAAEEEREWNVGG
jgi:hypothetical protein